MKIKLLNNTKIIEKTKVVIPQITTSFTKTIYCHCNICKIEKVHKVINNNVVCINCNNILGLYYSEKVDIFNKISFKKVNKIKEFICELF